MALPINENSPKMVKAGVAMAGGAGVLATLFIIFQDNKAVILIILVGIVLVGLLLVAYRYLLLWHEKRKAGGLEAGVGVQAGAVPNQISEAAKIGAIDGMRKVFLEGLQKFRANGKNIYTLPWYVCVGEPGSGKTEAIRRCGAKFPEGLQNFLQGTGGTLNMNWWFTNNGVILDTAGRVMFEEIAQGANSEWREFLKLLATNRKNCPVNGVILTIPATSLIEDDADQIARKAGKIAREFEMIQRTLEVRFPVFVLITKADKITGFREFFEDLRDPVLQHQMVGWSNPAPLDEPFRPEAIDTYLESVRQRLSERRIRVLIDPISRQDATAPRLDEVDALYAFPSSVAQLGQRLRQYLESIFSAGEWSPKPLFLRGIYFTSSLTEGVVLDQEIAKVLKIPIKDLPGGGVMKRERSYFLRDLFVEKIFKERGLVTRASNARQLQWRRKVLVLGFATASFLFLLLASWYYATQFSQSIGIHNDFWKVASKEFTLEPGFISIVDPKTGEYQGDKRISDEYPTVSSLHSRDRELAEKPIAIPVVFQPVAWIMPDAKSNSQKAHLKLFENTVVAPIINAARLKMANTHEFAASSAATQALVDLVKIERLATSTPSEPPDPDLFDHLMQFELSAADYKKYDETDRRNISIELATLYPKGSAKGDWPFASVKSDPQTIITSIANFSNYWATPPAVTGTLVGVQKSVKIYSGAEDAITTWRKATADPASFVDATAALDGWGKAYEALSNAKADLDKATATLAGGSTLSAAYGSACDAAAKGQTDAYKQMIDALKSDDPKDPLLPARESLESQIKTIGEITPAQQAMRAGLDSLDKEFLVAGAAGRAYEVRFRNAYSKGNEAVAATAPPTPKLQDVGTAKDGLDTSYGAATKALDSDPDLKGGKRFTDAVEATKFAITLAYQRDICNLFTGALKHTPAADTDVEKIVSDLAGSQIISRTPVDFTTVHETFDNVFNPQGAKAFLDMWSKLGDALKNSHVLDGQALQHQYDDGDAAVSAYKIAYKNYWSRDVLADLKVSLGTWADFQAGLSSSRIRRSQVGLELLGRRISEALDILPDADAKETQRKINDAKEAMLSRSFGDMRDKVFAYWASASDAPTVRSDLIGVDLKSAYDKCMFPVPLDELDYISIYYSDLTHKALELVAKEAAPDMRAWGREFAKYKRFPLYLETARPDTELSPEEFVKVAALVNKMVGSVSAAAPGTTLPAPTNLGVSDAAFIKEMEILRGPGLLAAAGLTAKELASMQVLVNALYDRDAGTLKSMKCTFSVSIAAKIAATSAVATYSTLTMEQDTLSGMSYVRDPHTADVLGAAVCPGKPVVFTWRTPLANANPVVHPIYPGSWAVIRAILLATPDPTDRKKWTLTINDGNPAETLTLDMELDQPISDISNLPTEK